MSEQPKRYLEIPFGVEAGTPSAYIPLGISEEDYDLLLKTLELWRPNIVVPDTEPQPSPELKR